MDVLATQPSPWASLEEALADLRAGRPVIVVDEPDRENEADLVLPAQFATAQQIAFFIREAMGLLCVAMEGRRLDELDIPAMTMHNTSHQHTPFTVSVEAANASTGVSAADRAATIRALIDDQTRPADLLRPGHVFPLRAAPGGLADRRGHTEASVELCRRAGLYPAAVIAEIMTRDGRMARGAELVSFARRHGLIVVPISALLDERPSRAPTPIASSRLGRIAESLVPMPQGSFRLIAYGPERNGANDLALLLGEPADHQPALVRIHSECFTGDVLGSLRCDCGQQLDRSLELIAAEQAGVVLYLRQEGRGIGLANKLRAYVLQDDGLDTVEANAALGFAPDLRDYSAAAAMLRDLGIRKVRLLTNNPMKVSGLQADGIDVERIPLEVRAASQNRNYLATKRGRLGHLLELIDAE